MQASAHDRRGELEQAREALREEIKKVVLAVNFDGRKTHSLVRYLTRVLDEESGAIPAGERPPEEPRLLETVRRAL